MPEEVHPADGASSPPAPGEPWPCPHCGTEPFEHRDTCGRNEVHPPDCRCPWCSHGVTWGACPCCGRGAHTAGPGQPNVVVCSAHGRQDVMPSPVAMLEALAAPGAPAPQLGVA